MWHAIIGRRTGCLDERAVDGALLKAHSWRAEDVGQVDAAVLLGKVDVLRDKGGGKSRRHDGAVELALVVRAEVVELRAAQLDQRAALAWAARRRDQVQLGLAVEGEVDGGEELLPIHGHAQRDAPTTRGRRRVAADVARAVPRTSRRPSPGDVHLTPQGGVLIRWPDVTAGHVGCTKPADVVRSAANVGAVDTDLGVARDRARARRDEGERWRRQMRRALVVPQRTPSKIREEVRLVGVLLGVGADLDGDGSNDW